MQGDLFQVEDSRDDDPNYRVMIVDGKPRCLHRSLFDVSFQETVIR